MDWVNKESLRPNARLAAVRWEFMNRDVSDNATVVPVSSTSAVVIYEQDRVEYSFFFFIPKGETEAVFIRDPDLIPEGRRRFRTRVEEALLIHRMRCTEAAKKQVLTP